MALSKQAILNILSTDDVNDCILALNGSANKGQSMLIAKVIKESSRWSALSLKHAHQMYHKLLIDRVLGASDPASCLIAISFLDKGAFVHPQPGITLIIFNESSPVECSQKS